MWSVITKKELAGCRSLQPPSLFNLTKLPFSSSLQKPMAIAQGLDEVTKNTRQKSKIFYSGTLMELLAGAEPPAQESEP